MDESGHGREGPVRRRRGGRRWRRRPTHDALLDGAIHVGNPKLNMIMEQALSDMQQAAVFDTHYADPFHQHHEIVECWFVRADVLRGDDRIDFQPATSRCSRERCVDVGQDDELVLFDARSAAGESGKAAQSPTASASAELTSIPRARPQVASRHATSGYNAVGCSASARASICAYCSIPSLLAATPCARPWAEDRSDACLPCPIAVETERVEMRELHQAAHSRRRGW